MKKTSVIYVFFIKTEFEKKHELWALLVSSCKELRIIKSKILLGMQILLEIILKWKNYIY